MDGRRGPLTGWSVLGLFLGAIGSILAWRLIVGRRQMGYRALVEYWVYSSNPRLPDTKRLLERLFRENPYLRPHRPCIGHDEGLLMSDVRLHLAVALRAKNPHVFRPDLLLEEMNPNGAALAALAPTTGVVKARFTSEVLLEDDRHLRLMPQLAGALLDLCEGVAVFDLVQEVLYTAEEFREILRRQGRDTPFASHVRALWREEGETAFAETRGLAKSGLPELKTDPVEKDFRVLLLEIVEQAAVRLLEERTTPKTMEIAAYDDLFLLEFRPERGKTGVSIRRQRQV